jgi:ribonucleotide monophosphatase NagD (HAD superfamily)
MTQLKYQTFAIDFDGTIVTDGVFPEIGTLLPHAKRVMEKIVQHGGRIAIWTCRSGFRQELVREWLIEHEIPFLTLNEPFPEVVQVYGETGRKIFADLYIDDRSLHAALHGGIDWLEIEKFIFTEE